MVPSAHSIPFSFTQYLNYTYMIDLSTTVTRSIALTFSAYHGQCHHHPYDGKGQKPNLFSTLLCHQREQPEIELDISKLS
jgi:hypothetical protein